MRISTGITLSGRQEYRTACFLLLLAATLVGFLQPLVTLLVLSFQDGRFGHYSHIALIPFLSLYVLYVDRKAIFATTEWGTWPGLLLMTMGATLCWRSGESGLESLDSLILLMLSLVSVGWGAFLLCYGPLAFQKASFGLLLLLFMVPLPPLLLDAIIGFLQWGSAEATDFLFRVLSISVSRHGLVFELPNLAIQIAEECSGIRSSLALLIVSLVAGHLSLGAMWTRLALLLFVIPLTIVKNAVRIVGLSLLGNYVDPSFVGDSLFHKTVGIPLFVMALAVLAFMCWVLKRAEALTPHLAPGVRGGRPTRREPVSLI